MKNEPHDPLYETTGTPMSRSGTGTNFHVGKAEHQLRTLAFMPAKDAPPRHIHAQQLSWSRELIQQLLFVQKAGSEVRGKRVNLPYGALRAALQIRLPALYRIDPKIALAYVRPDAAQQPFALLGEKLKNARGSNAAAVVSACLRDWSVSTLQDFVGDEETGQVAVARVRRMAEDGSAFELQPAKWHSLPWIIDNVTGTAGPIERHHPSYAALAEDVAAALQGCEILPGTGPLRRVVDNDPKRNTASLLSDILPVPGGEGEFSFLVTIQVQTAAGVGHPIVVFNLSKRRWIGGELKDFIGAKSIGGHVFCDSLPDRVLSFSCQRTALGDKKYDYLTDDSFEHIKSVYNLPLDLRSARSIAINDFRLSNDTRIRLIYANGLTKVQHPMLAGVPERDWLDAFNAAIPLLAGIGLVPMEDVTPVASKRQSRRAPETEKAGKRSCRRRHGT